MIGKSHAQDDLVESLDEITVQELLLIDRFTNNTADEFEELLVLRINCRLRVGIIG
jgi:hypothetical protein